MECHQFPFKLIFQPVTSLYCSHPPSLSLSHLSPLSLSSLSLSLFHSLCIPLFSFAPPSSLFLTHSLSLSLSLSHSLSLPPFLPLLSLLTVPAAPVVPQAVPAANRQPQHPSPSRRAEFWGQACPHLESPASPQADPPLTAEREAEATQLTKTLRTPPGAAQ